MCAMIGIIYFKNRHESNQMKSSLHTLVKSNHFWEQLIELLLLFVLRALNLIHKP